MNHNHTETVIKRETAMMSSVLPWLMWLIGSLFVLYQFLLQSSTSVMISDLQQSLHIDAAQIGFLSSTFFYTYLLLQVPAGLLVDRFGGKRVLIISLILCGFSVWMFSSSYHYWSAISSRLLMGLMSTPAVAATLYISAHWFPAKRFSLIVGLMESFAMLGMAVGAFYLAYFTHYFGWRPTMKGAALIGILLAILSILLLRDQPFANKLESAASKPTRPINMIHHLLSILKSPQIWLNGIHASCTFALISAFAGLWGISYLQTRYNVSLETAALGCSLLFSGVAVGCPLMGYLSGQFDGRKSILFYAPLCASLLMLLIIFFPYLPLWIMYPLLFILGILSSAYVIPFGLVRDIAISGSCATAMAFINMMAILLGSFIFQPLIGYLLKIHTSSQTFIMADYRFALLVLPCGLLLAVIITPFIHDPLSKNVKCQ